MIGERTRKRKLRILVDPKTILASVILGMGTGYLFPSFGPKAQEVGKLYLALLQMVVLPILITAVVSSLGRLFSSGEASIYIKRLLIVFSAGVILAGGLGTGIGLIGQPGKALKESAQNTLGNVLTERETTAVAGPSSKSPGLLGFVKMMVPTNPFEAVMQGKNLPTIFFCILFGISLGLLRTTSAATTLAVAEAVFEALLRMIGWIMHGLPAGLFCLFASQVSQTGFGIFFALGKLIVCAYAGALILVFLYVLATARMTKKSIPYTFVALKDPILVAMGTSSSFATIPVSLVTLENKLKIESNMAKLVVPLGVSLNPQGSVMYFSLATIFMTQFYDLHLGPEGYLIVILGSILSAISVTGVPAVAALSVLSIVLDPLGLPTEAAVILLLAINPFIDPVLTCVNVLANCAATSIVARNSRALS